VEALPMKFQNYYEVLGVTKAADAAEIKKAYRKLARKYHPDVSKEADAEHRMKEINEANAVLSDAEKRAAYDALASGHRDGQDFRPPPGWDENFEFSGGFRGAQADDFSEFFSSLFGQTRQGARGAAHTQSGHAPTMRGEDHHARVTIDLADAYEGGTRVISLRSAHFDHAGRPVNDERTLSVRIPKGVCDGQHIRLAGQGSPGFNGGAAGDLFLEVHFSPDPRYLVDGRNVTQRLPVTPWEAALGAAIHVLTPSGSVQVKVPAGSQAGQKLRLKGRGIPGEAPGDLFLDIAVVLPDASSARAKELYAAMASELAFDPRAPH
jgi:curved DNA-binding protein